MLSRFVNVLLVDDEPDVLAVSKLALKQMTVYGVPLRIHEAESKAAAVEFLQNHPDATYLATAIIDVVMESDHAGLELCEFIRDDLGNPVLPLIIRTGQAGKAPEREVIDQYDITGYIEKVEATEQRLYSILKCGIRQYLATAHGYFASQAVHRGILSVKSPEQFVDAARAGLRSIFTAPTGVPIEGQADSHAFLSERFFAGTGELEDQGRATEIRDRLAAGDGEPLGPGGDRMVVDGDHLLIHAGEGEGLPRPFDSVWTITAPPPPFVTQALYSVTKQSQMLTEVVPW